MRNRWKVLAAFGAGVAIAVPATVMAGGDPGIVGDVGGQNWESMGKATVPAHWTPLPGAIGHLNLAPGPHSLIVSADMAKGKAKFRVVSGSVLKPGAILFAGQGANSFTFAYPEGCGPDINPTLEWERAGAKTAVTRRITTLNISAGSLCAF